MAGLMQQVSESGKRLGEALRGQLDVFTDERDDFTLIVDEPGQYCWRCGSTIAEEAVASWGCVFCRKKKLWWENLIRLSEYHSDWGEAIRAMKFGRQWFWGRTFGRKLAQCVGPWPDEAGPVVVTYVPMPRLRRWRRGFNQAQLIAKAFGQARGWPVLPLLRRVEYRSPQTHVAPGKRHDNVRRAFAAQPVDLTGWTVWLIDDVKTTGSTLSVCAHHLMRMGAARVRVGVVAVADPMGAGFTRV